MVSYINELRHVYLFRVRVRLGFGLVSFMIRFNDKNAFSKLGKKIPDFSCTHGRMCVYGRYAPEYQLENNNNNNNNNNLLQRIQQSEALHLQHLHQKSTLKKQIYIKR